MLVEQVLAAGSRRTGMQAHFLGGQLINIDNPFISGPGFEWFNLGPMRLPCPTPKAASGKERAYMIGQGMIDRWRTVFKGKWTEWLT